MTNYTFVLFFFYQNSNDAKLIASHLYSKKLTRANYIKLEQTAQTSPDCHAPHIKHNNLRHSQI